MPAFVQFFIAHRKKYYIAKLIGLTLSVITIISIPAKAQEGKLLVSPKKQVIYFDLPSQSLKNSLIEFAVQSKFNIVVDTKLVEGFRSTPLIGPHSPEKALKILISKAPLTFKVYDQKKTILIESAKVFVDTTEHESQDISPDDNYIEETIVRSNFYPFKYNTVSNSQLYGNLNFFNSARFISTIPATLINDQAPVELAEALRLSSGFTPGDGLADSNDDYYVRGFPRHGIFADGFRLHNNTGAKLLPQNIERIEILKGPSTLFYGQAEPGGIVNVVRKKPQKEAQHTLSLIGGSGIKEQTAIDLTGPIAFTDNAIQYRLIATDNRHDNFRNIRNIEQQLIAPSINWDISASTQIDFNYEKQESQQVNPQDTVMLAPFGDEISIFSLSNSPRMAQPEFYSEKELLNLNFSHYFSNSWSIRTKLFGQNELWKGVRANQSALLATNFLASAEDFEPNENIIWQPNALIPTPIGSEVDSDLPQESITTLYSIYNETGEESSTYAQVLVNGSFNILSTEHDLSFGIDAHQRDTDEQITLEVRNDLVELTIDNSPENRLEAIFSGIFIPNAPLGELVNRSQSRRFTDYGFFILDSVSLSDTLQFSFGGRVSHTSALDLEDAGNELRSYTNFSTELGIRYEPFDDFAIYTNYSEGFKANYQVDEVGTQIHKPEESKQLEIGTKSILFGGKLISTSSVFYIKKENVVDIGFDQGFRVAYNSGRQTHFGFDLDLSYQISKNTNLVCSLGLLDARKDDTLDTQLVPKMTADVVGSLFLNHEIKQSFAKGLSLSAGVYHVGDRFADLKNTVVLDNYTLIDLNASYPFKLGPIQYRIHLSAKNVLGEEFILAREESIRETRGNDTTYQATLEFSF